MGLKIHFPADISYTESTISDFEIEKGKLLNKYNLNKVSEDNNFENYLISAIPKPLAVLYAYKNAFEHFIQNDDVIEGEFSNTVKFVGPYAQMVSDTLDLIQWIFERDNYDDIKIVKWSKENRINAMVNSGDSRLKHFAETMNSYMEDITNFNEIYLIFYNKNDVEILLGGTSPFNMVYLSPNAKRLLKDKNVILKSHDGDTFFDDDIKSLANRSSLFKDYMFYVKNQMANSAIDIPFRQYIELELGNNYTATNENFIIFKDNNNSNLKFNDRDFSIMPIIQKFDSELRIKYNISSWNSNNAVTHPPLVIEIGKLDNKKLGDIKLESIRTNLWIEEVNRKLSIWDREIPGKNVKYPWILTSEFFNEYLIEIEGKELDTNSFLLGNNNKKYLLPISELFLQFFKIENLNSYVKFSSSGNEVRVSIKIPLLGDDNFEISKIYSSTFIKKISLGVFISPNYKKSENDIFEILMIFDNSNENYSIKFNDQLKNKHLEFYDNKTEKGKIWKKEQKSNHVSEFKGGVFYRFNFTSFESFTHINIKIHQSSNDIINFILVPNFKTLPKPEQQSNANFAIDFGTSNTFIAVDYNNEKSSLEFNDFTLSLHKIEQDGSDLLQIFGDAPILDEFRKYFVPIWFSENENTQSNNANHSAKSVHKTILLSNGESEHILHNNAIAFYYDYINRTNEGEAFYSNIKPKLEIESGLRNGINVSVYIRELLYVIKLFIDKNKVPYEKVKLIYTYPSTGDFKSKLEKIFEENIDYIFNKKISLDSDSEAISPFRYLTNFKKNGKYLVELGGIKKGSINVDIGGGTTDISFNNDNNNYLITSFAFAGNHLWGGEISPNNESKDNIFLKIWQKEFLNKDDTDLLLKYNEINGKTYTGASDLVNLLFSNERYEFINIFENNEKNLGTFLKALALFHFSSILYYTLKLCSINEITNIHSLTFTGKGSLYLNKIIFQDNNKLIDYIKVFIENFKNELSINISIEKANIICLDNPKEITAIGALYKFGNNTAELNTVTSIQYPNNIEKKFRYGNDTNNLSHTEKNFIEIESDINTLFPIYFNTLSETIFKNNVSLLKEYINIINPEKFDLIKNEWNRVNIAHPQIANDTLFFIPCLIFFKEFFASRLYNQFY
ncbi:MAG: hypothetical protein R2771_06545 [Saprospiraceae bacterium]